jgi:molybdopterin-guanine dinucleotide biosynthesis protein A
VARERLTGVLLVGGASVRFGSPKALAELRGETLAARAWRTLGEACDERIAVGKAADRLDLPFPLLDDGVELRAPIAGVAAGLASARSELCVFLPVDCPLVDAALLGRLARACVGADVAVPQTGPLPGAYRRSALPVLQRRLAAERLSLRGALAELGTRSVELDESLLINVNTVDDLQRLLQGSDPSLARVRPPRGDG